MANQNEDYTVQEVDLAIDKTELFIMEHKKQILSGIIAIVLVVTAVWGWTTYWNTQNQKAQDEIYPAQFLFEQGKYEQALEGFESVIDNYGSTKTGNLAKAYAGICQKELGNYTEAISLLKDYSGNDIVVAPAMLSALGDCYVSLENADYREAATCFEKAAKAADNAQFTPIYLKKAGLAYENQGDNASALKCYQAIKDNWAETSTAQSIDKYIERVK